jgi:hypothetical protein
MRNKIEFQRELTAAQVDMNHERGANKRESLQLEAVLEIAGGIIRIAEALEHRNKVESTKP